MSDVRRAAATPAPSRPRFEHHEEGRLGIGEATPRLSWTVPDAPAGLRVLGYEVHARRADGTVDRWEADGDSQVLVPWGAQPLRSRTAVAAKVRLRSPSGWGPWGEEGHVETGLLDPEDWKAHFVGVSGADAPGDGLPSGGLRRPIRIRKRFALPRVPADARVYVTAHGLVELEINGVRVGDEELTPGWTSYGHRLRYATFDIGHLLRSGDNIVGAWLGDGWYRGRIGFRGGVENHYGSDLSALIQLEMTMPDAARVDVVSDESWERGAGPILSSGLYEGEHFDARLATAWTDPQSAPLSGRIEDPQWYPVDVIPTPSAVLVAPLGPPVRRTGELIPIVTRIDADTHLLDFGQNHTGRLRLRVSGRRGAALTLRHAEVLQEGRIYTRPLRGAAATDVYELSGDPEGESWEPRFTLHGFRYAEVTGWPGDLAPTDVVSRVYGTDLQRAGWFESSDADVNRLHENVVWSARSNFVDIPTDCPQRDERLGWTGDVQVFGPTAAFLFDVTGMFGSWLTDVALEQREWGFVPFYVPYLPLGSWQSRPRDPSAVWGDVTVLTPADLHAATADIDILRRQYESATTFLAHVESMVGEDLIPRDAFQLGDWLDPSAPPDDPFAATTSTEIVATAYFAHSARRLAHIAETLDLEVDAARFHDLSARVRTAFRDEFLDGDVLREDTQTAHSLAIVFDLLPDDARLRSGERLAALVRRAEGRISTGFAGTPLVARALVQTGHPAEAYRLVLARDCPSWLYAVDMGATTIWERWDSMLPDGTVNPGEMTSFNHFALGAVAEWMHTSIAGISPSAPGYRRIRFEPVPGGGLDWARARHLTPYGEASIEWRRRAGALEVTTTVPFGARGELIVGGEVIALEHGTRTEVVAVPDGALAGPVVVAG
ncbi:family 78 glycoside hydrolase catalytic domain [Microbacterium forte]